MFSWDFPLFFIVLCRVEYTNNRMKIYKIMSLQKSLLKCDKKRILMDSIVYVLWSLKIHFLLSKTNSWKNNVSKEKYVSDGWSKDLNISTDIPCCYYFQKTCFSQVRCCIFLNKFSIACNVCISWKARCIMMLFCWKIIYY